MMKPSITLYSTAVVPDSSFANLAHHRMTHPFKRRRSGGNDKAHATLSLAKLMS